MNEKQNEWKTLKRGGHNPAFYASSWSLPVHLPGGSLKLWTTTQNAALCFFDVLLFSLGPWCRRQERRNFSVRFEERLLVVMASEERSGLGGKVKLMKKVCVCACMDEKGRWCTSTAASATWQGRHKSGTNSDKIHMLHGQNQIGFCCTVLDILTFLQLTKYEATPSAINIMKIWWGSMCGSLVDKEGEE